MAASLQRRVDQRSWAPVMTVSESTPAQPYAMVPSHCVKRAMRTLHFVCADIERRESHGLKHQSMTSHVPVAGTACSIGLGLWVHHMGVLIWRAQCVAVDGTLRTRDDGVNLGGSITDSIV